MGKKPRRESKSQTEADPIEPGSEESEGHEQHDDVTYAGAVNLPAHRTKHLAQLKYSFPSLGASFDIAQCNDSNSTGSSLWLSSQVLSSYLIHTCYKPGRKAGLSNRAIELGSGTGLLSLLLARCGWQVLATDLGSVIETILGPNVQAGNSQLDDSGHVDLHELDWLVEPAKWNWNQAGPFTSTAPACELSTHDFDLILTADTIYESTLIRPLLRAISFLYNAGQRKPTVLLALERRDSAHVDAALHLAQSEFGLPFRRIPPRQVRKIFDLLGDGKTWSRNDWDGVEIWKI